MSFDEKISTFSAFFLEVIKYLLKKVDTILQNGKNNIKIKYPNMNTHVNAPKDLCVLKVPVTVFLNVIYSVVFHRSKQEGEPEDRRAGPERNLNEEGEPIISLDVPHGGRNDRCPFREEGGR